MSLLYWFRKRKSSYDTYSKGLQRYRQIHPESLEQDREKINQWLAYVQSRKVIEAQQRDERQQVEMRRAAALSNLREAARTAFMSHPAATEYDFHRCWPYIREEILKRHALDELAANPELLAKITDSENELPHVDSRKKILSAG